MSQIPEKKTTTPIPWYKKKLDFRSLLNRFSHPAVKAEVVKDTAPKRVIKDIRAKAAASDDTSTVKNPDILDIDLIKDEVPVIFDSKKHLYALAAFIMLSFFLVFEVYFFLYSWEKQEISKKADALTEEITRLDGQIIELKKEAASATDWRNRMNSITPVFNNHVYWSNLLRYLENNTLADVYYSGLSGDTGGSYLLHSWVKDFRAISFQLKTILADNLTASAKISNEKVNNGDQSQGVLFDLNLSVKPRLFTE